MAARRKKANFWQKVLEYGLITGIAILYVCLVGMIEDFDDRDVIAKVISLGRTLLVVISLGMGYLTAWKVAEGKTGLALLGSIIVGLIGTVMTAGLVLLTNPLSLRAMFVNASPALIEILTFSQESQTTGLLLLGAMLSGVSLVGAIIYLLPDKLRRTLITSLIVVLLLGMLQELLSVMLSRSDLTEPIAAFLFGRRGLSIPGTITVFVGFGVLNYLWRSQGEAVKEGVRQLPPTQQKGLRWFGLGLGILLLLALPQLTGAYVSQILVLVGLYILMGLGLNIEIGLAGLLDLGFVGFYAIGAYTVALLTSTGELGMASVVAEEATKSSYTSFWAAIPVAVIIAGLSGVFLGIPVLRMRGDYLAIVTLGLAEIIRILVLSNFLQPILGGAQGVLNIPKPTVPLVGGFVEGLPSDSFWMSIVNFFVNAEGKINDPQHFYYLILIGCVIVGFVASRLQHSRVGRNWMAIREDEDVAEAMGINIIATKLLAFGMGAAFAGLSGAIFAAQVGSVFPHSFALLVSINVVCLIIVGGSGSMPGVVIGSLILVGLPELLREFSEFRLLIYGALLVVMMLVKPEGFWPSEVVRRELQDEADETELGIEVEPTPA